MNLIDAGNLMMLVEAGLGPDHAKIISDQWRAKCAEIERLALHNSALEAALQAKTDEFYPDLRATIDRQRAALKPFADFAEKAEAFVEARAKDGGSPILPSTDFRLADFRRARAALDALPLQDRSKK